MPKFKKTIFSFLMADLEERKTHLCLVLLQNRIDYTGKEGDESRVSY